MGRCRQVVHKAVGGTTSQEIGNKKNNYSDLVIVAENEWKNEHQDKNICLYNTVWEIAEDNYVYCKKLIPGIDTCHAEVLFIANHAVAVTVRKEFEAGDFMRHHLVVIRILEEKQKILKEFDDRSAADVTFVVNGEECKGDRKNLAVVSPVFDKMLYGEFVESQQDVIPLEGIESAELFKDFLLAVSPLRIQPNPRNVVALLKLAHQYDIPFLMRNCEDHLMHCYEIPIADRLLQAGKYRLDCPKVHITQQLSTDQLKKIHKEKYQELCELDSGFIMYLTSFLTD